MRVVSFFLSSPSDEKESSKVLLSRLVQLVQGSLSLTAVTMDEEDSKSLRAISI